MRSLRILAADDEPVALDRLSDLLSQIKGTELVATVRNGREAIDAISSLYPDLVLLDVEMPGIDGFDIVEALIRRDHFDCDSTPLICFVTAYPQFASDAFETGALDFLCKPVRISRLEKTIVRARVALDRRQAVGRLEELSAHLEHLRRARAADDDHWVWLQQRGEFVKVDLAALDWIEAEGEYVRLHFGDKSHLLRSSMTAACEDFADRGIVRIHRSFAINQKRIRAVRRSRSGMTVVIEKDVELPVGRKFRKNLENELQAGSHAI